MTYDPGRPWQPPPTSATVSTQLVARVYAMVLEDTSMLGTIATGAVVSALVFAGIAVPAWLLGGLDLLTDSFNPATLVLYAVAGWASAFVTILFSGAVVAAGVARLDGHPITAPAALGVAWSRRRQLCAWAVVTTVVGLVAEQLNRFGVLGTIARLLAGLTWAVATLLVLPIIIVEGHMPKQAITESASLMKNQLMLTVRTKARLYLPWMAVMVIGAIVTAGGLIAFFHYRDETPEWSIAGLLLAVLGVLVLALAVCVTGAAGELLNLMLYRHALGLPVPGVDARDLPRLAVPPGSAPPTAFGSATPPAVT